MLKLTKINQVVITFFAQLVSCINSILYLFGENLVLLANNLSAFGLLTIFNDFIVDF